MRWESPSGRVYRLLPYELSTKKRIGGASGSRRPDHPYAEAQGGPGSAVLFTAAMNNLWLFRRMALVIAAVAVVMSAVVRAHGGPYSTRQHPHLLLSIISATVFWSLVLVGLFGLVRCIIRFRQARAERQAHLAGAAGSPTSLS